MAESRNLPEASTIAGSLGRDRVSREVTTAISPPVDALSGLAVKTEGLSPTELIELLQSDQLGRWRSGESPSAESYLERWPVLRDHEDALDLVYAEVLLRRERGDSPSLDEYLQRFPRFAEELKLHFELEPWVADEPAAASRASTLEVSGLRTGALPRRRSAAPVVPGYEIEGELGRGGMGVVYKARQIRLNRLCALKMILAGPHADPEAFIRFLGEAEAVARLNHPNIIQIHRTGEVDGLPFLELEYVDGESLAAQLNGTPWAPRRAAVLIEVLARAMAEAHRQGVVHRDLKPANILMADDDMPKITDFGLAKALGTDSGLTRTNSVIGSPSYMAPEQAEGHARDAGPPTDIYSLGAILYELLTGRPPFKAASVAETMEQVRVLEPVPPLRLVPGLPRDVETICLTCLRKEPSRRFASALELADDLRRFLDGQVIRSRRSTVVERGWRWARRNRTVAALLAALVLTMATGFAGTVLLWRRAEHEASNATRLARSETSLRRAAQVQAASLAFDRAIALAEDGDPDRALHWLALAAVTAPTSEPGLGRVARANLANVGARLAVLNGFYRPGVPGRELRIGPDARTFLEFGPDSFAQIKDALTGRELSPRLPQSSPISTIAFSPGGTKLATWSHDRHVQVFSLPEGRPQANWLTSDSPVRILFSPSGSMLATIGIERSPDRANRTFSRIRLWQLPEARELVPPAAPANSAIAVAAFSPDGSMLAFVYRRDQGNQDEVLLWNIQTGKGLKLPVSDPHGFHAIQFGADSRALLLQSITRTLIVDVTTGHSILPDPIGPPSMPDVKTTDPVLFAVGLLTPDGRTMALGDVQGYAQFRSVDSGKLSAPIFRHGTAVDIMAISPDGQTALIVGGFTGRLYDIPTGQALGGKMELPQDPAAARIQHRSATFDAQGRTVAIVSGRAVTVWDVTAVRGGPRMLPHRIGPGPLAFSPDGRRLLTGSLVQPTARLWDTATGEPVGPVLVHDSPPSGGGTTRVHVAAFSPDGRVAMTAGDDRCVRFWDPQNGQSIGRALQQPHWVVSAAFSPDSKKLLVGTAAGTAVLWDLDGQPTMRKTIEGPGPHAEAMGFSLDGKTALLRTHQFNPLLIDAATGDVVRTLHEDVASSGFAFLSDGESALSLAGGSLRRFDPRIGSTLGSLFGSSINAFTVSPDGTLALTGGEDGALQVWNASLGTMVGRAMAHRSPIRAVAFSPDNRTVASGDQDGTIRYWNLATRRQIGPPVRLGVQASRLVFGPSGRVLAANGDLVRLCDVPDSGRGVAGRADLWAQVRTGHRLDEGGGVIPLEQHDWERLRREVETPRADLGPLVDSQSAEELNFAWHEQNTRDSERKGLHYSSLWHLDRMIAIRPGDAWLYVRRARVLHATGREANADERHFRDLGSRTQQNAWDSDEAIRHEAAGNWSAAIGHYDRLVAAMPDDEWLCHRRARILARLGRWPEAAAVYARCVPPEFNLPFVFSERLFAQIRAGDQQGYRTSCRELMSRTDVTRSPFVAYLAALAFTAAPDAVDDRALAVQLAESALRRFGDGRNAEGLVVLGAAQFRAGKLEEAVRSLTESVRREDNAPRAWVYLAMAHLAGGHEQAARPWINRLKMRTPSHRVDDFWDEVEIEILSREVDTLRKP